MNKNTGNNVKNALAIAGAIAVVKAAPVLVAGVAIGSILSNPNKVKNAVSNLVVRVEDEIAKRKVEPETDGGFESCIKDDDITTAEEEGEICDKAEKTETDEEDDEDKAKKEKLDKFFKALQDLMYDNK